MDQATDTEVVPELPGAETNTVDCAVAIEAKNPGVIEKDIAGVLVLGVKLASPM